MADRISTIKVQVEYKPVHRDRISAVKVVVEWKPPVVYTRKYGPAVQ